MAKKETSNVNYSVTILEASKELSPKEKVMMKDTTNAIKLDEATKEGDVLIHVDYYVVLSVHNSKADREDYDVYLIADKDGTKYVTGSPSFWSSFLDIMAEMTGVTDEEWGVKVYKVPSKNYKGKDFITCSVV